MALLTGKTLQFWTGTNHTTPSREIAVESVSSDVDFQEIDVTDSSSGYTGTNIMLGRAKRSLKVSGFYYGVDGAEVVSGSLTAGTKYRLTGGAFGISQYIGQIFTAAGTETASGTNKCKPLGTIVNGKNMTVTIGGSAHPVTSFKYNEQYSEFDATNTTTAGNATEFVTGRAKRTGTIEVIMESSIADLITESDPANQAMVITLSSGTAMTAVGILKKKAVSAKVSDMTKVVYDIVFQGEPSTAFPNLTSLGVSQGFFVILGFGATGTNQAYVGNGVAKGLSIDANVKGDVKISYDIDWSGAIVESEAGGTPPTTLTLAPDDVTP